MPGLHLYETDQQKIATQSRNSLRLYDEVRTLASLPANQRIISPQIIKDLHRIVIQDIYTCAGSFRDWGVKIKNAKHIPPSSKFVDGMVSGMCEQVNSETEWTPTKAAAYVLWRLNWIHPFGGGNGRTARAASCVMLIWRIGFTPAGRLTIPEQIRNDRPQFQEALEDADAAWSNSVLDVSKMERMLDDFLVIQLRNTSGRREECEHVW